MLRATDDPGHGAAQFCGTRKADIDAIHGGVTAGITGRIGAAYGVPFGMI